MRRLLVLSTALVVLAATPLASQTTVELSRVNGLVSEGVLDQDQTPTFVFRLTNGTQHVVTGASMGFRVYSPDGALWDTTIIDTTANMGRDEFPMGLYLRHFSADGTVADTVGFLGLGENLGLPSGLPAGYSEDGLAVTIGPFSAESRGKTICIDSSFYYNGGVWKWVLSEPSEVIPSWDGPHCYRVECCERPGDIDDSGSSTLDISDIVYAVEYMYGGGPPPPCPEQMDVNGSGGIPDISDLVYLVNYMFSGGPPPQPCPGTLK
jgi:hypothetical protein